MLCLGAVAQFQHITQNRNPPSGTVAQNTQRRRHRLGTCIVTVFDNGIFFCLKNLLTAGHILESSQALHDPV